MKKKATKLKKKCVEEKWYDGYEFPNTKNHEGTEIKIAFHKNMDIATLNHIETSLKNWFINFGYQVSIECSYLQDIIK